jgi:predicted O-methyltransferase YrrM
MPPSTNSPSRIGTAREVRRVIERLDRDGFVVARADGSKHDVRTVSISTGEGEALRKWVSSESATRTVEVGLGYGLSALYICEGLIQIGHPDARHVVLDPFQAGRFADCGLQVLEEAGVRALVEFYAELSQIALPAFLKEGRRFDFGFIDGNHRFDSVFVDLFYFGRLLRKGGVVMLDDYDLPGIERAVSFFQTNLGWTIEETARPEDRHHWVVLRTAVDADTRDFRYFVEF